MLSVAAEEFFAKGREGRLRGGGGLIGMIDDMQYVICMMADRWSIMDEE